MRAHPLHAGAALAALLLAAAPLRGQAEPLRLPRLTGPVVLDGRPDEAAWAAVEPLPLAVHLPTAGAPPTERTEIRVAYDDGYLYAAARLWDSRPDGVRANSLTRDRWSGDDTFNLLVDASNDDQNALWFQTTPGGIRRDLAISNNAEGPAPINASWNSFWEVATTRTPEGWFAEMRIPFSTLRFQARGGRAVVGIAASRYIARKPELHTFPAFPADREMNELRPALMRDAVLEGVRAARPVYLTPYLLAGRSRLARLDAAGGAWESLADPTRDAGLDLKYGLTGSLTLDMTVNTDFAQVEADDEQVNLTRFSLAQPERRPFFQERAGLFDFNTGGPTGLFYSRRIGLSEEGEPVRILGGARVVGRAGAWDVGALGMRTAAHGGAPGESFAVLRARRPVLDPVSYAGAMLTTRLDGEGRYNVAYGLDASVRLPGEHFVTGTWSQSVRDGGSASPADGGRARARFERRSSRGAVYDLDLQWSGREYDPGIGFVTLQDFHRVGGRLGYAWAPDGGGLRRHGANLIGGTVFRNADGSVESGRYVAEWWGESRGGPWGVLGAHRVRESLRDTFALPAGAEVPAGEYTFHRLVGSFDPGTSRLFRVGGRLEAGTFYDGWSGSVAARPTWNVSPRLELGAAYELSAVRFPARGQGFEAHLAQLRATAALNTRVSASAVAQYSSLRDLATANLRLRYSFREGNDLFLVFNEGINTDRFATDPTLPLSGSRTVLLKYTHTFG
jgi:hypothetical protein